MGRSDREPVRSIPTGGAIASSILVGVGAFMLLLSSIMISLLTQINITLLLLGSMVSFAGIAIFMPSAISISTAIASNMRTRSSAIKAVIAKALGDDHQEILEEILSTGSQPPSLLNSLKLSMVSIILLIMLLLSIFLDMPAIARLLMLLVGATIAPITMIIAASSLVEELRAWLERHIAIELYILSRINQSLRIQRAPQMPRRQLISNSILASIVTMGLYTIYMLPVAILELSRHIEWHRDYEQEIAGKIR